MVNFINNIPGGRCLSIMKKISFSSKFADYVLFRNKIDENIPYTIFLHGGPGFNNLAEREILGKYYHDKLNVLWFDMLGCYEAPAKDPEYINLENTITDIIRIIDQFAGGFVNLVGFCISSQLVHSIVKRFPEKVNKVVLLSPCESMAQTYQNILTLAKDSEQLILNENEVELFNEFMQVTDSTFNSDVLKTFAGLALKTENLYDLYWYNKNAMIDYFTYAEKAPLNIDVFSLMLLNHFSDLPNDYMKLYMEKEILVCRGERDQIIRWEQNGKKIIDALPDVKSVLIPDAGHWIHFENAVETSKVGIDFILS